MEVPIMESPRRKPTLGRRVSHIVGLSSKEEVFRPDAVLHVASMTNIKALIKLPISQLIRDPMCPK
jgi:hypothetical protein